LCPSKEETTCDHLQIQRRPLQTPTRRPRLPHRPGLVERLITAYTTPGQPYKHEDYGYVFLIQEADVNRTLDEIWDICTLLDMLWEGIMLRDGFFIAIYLANNEYGLVCVIPAHPG
jgi:hypothetical protein